MISKDRTRLIRIGRNRRAKRQPAILQAATYTKSRLAKFGNFFYNLSGAFYVNLQSLQNYKYIERQNICRINKATY